MDTDDLEPVEKKPDQKDLEIMSIEALREYIAEMERERGCSFGCGIFFPQVTGASRRHGSIKSLLSIA